MALKMRGIPDDFPAARKPVEREANIEGAVVAWAENNAWEVRKMRYLGRRSCPDRFFFGYGQIIMVEFKKPGGKLSEGQKLEHTRLRAVGVEVNVFDTVSSAIAFLKGKMQYHISSANQGYRE